MFNRIEDRTSLLLAANGIVHQSPKKKKTPVATHINLRQALASPAKTQSFNDHERLRSVTTLKNRDTPPVRKRVRFAEEVLERTISESSSSDTSSSNGSRDSLSGQARPIMLRVSSIDKTNLPDFSKGHNRKANFAAQGQKEQIHYNQFNNRSLPVNATTRNPQRRAHIQMTKLDSNMNSGKPRPSEMAPRKPQNKPPLRLPDHKAHLPVMSEKGYSEPIIILASALLSRDGVTKEDHTYLRNGETKASNLKGQGNGTKSSLHHLARRGETKRGVGPMNRTLPIVNTLKKAPQRGKRTKVAFRDV